MLDGEEFHNDFRILFQLGRVQSMAATSHAIAGMFVAIFESQFGDAPACFALRTRASFEDRHPAKTKATLRPKTIRDVLCALADGEPDAGFVRCS